MDPSPWEETASHHIKGSWPRDCCANWSCVPIPSFSTRFPHECWGCSALHMELIPADKPWVNPARSPRGNAQQQTVLPWYAEVTQDSTWTKHLHLQMCLQDPKCREGVTLRFGHLNLTPAFWIYQARAQLSPWGMVSQRNTSDTNTPKPLQNPDTQTGVEFTSEREINCKGAHPCFCVNLHELPPWIMPF